MGLLCMLGLSSCGPTRLEHKSLATVNNLQGFNESGGELLSAHSVAMCEYEGDYFIRFHDAWIALAGKPANWYRTKDNGIRICLIRRLRFPPSDLTEADLAMAMSQGGNEDLEVIEMQGAVSMERYNGGRLLYFDIQSSGPVEQNRSWLNWISQSGFSLLAERLGAVPGEKSIATVKGQVVPIKVHSGW